MDYPSVLGEVETLDQILAGRSISRYGDGEFKLAGGLWIKCQVENALLGKRLREILYESGECLVGIPNILSPTPKAKFWNAHRRCASFLSDRPYVSSLITRPDSAPWIDTPEYWAKVASLWRGQAVTLVRGSGKSFTGEMLLADGAAEVTEIICNRANAWQDYHSIMDRIGRPARALLCLGPTATVMAVDLCAKGVHALDLGHLGMFYKKHQQGLPMWVTKDDKVAV